MSNQFGAGLAGWTMQSKCQEETSPSGRECSTQTAPSLELLQ